MLHSCLTVKVNPRFSAPRKGRTVLLLSFLVPSPPHNPDKLPGIIMHALTLNVQTTCHDLAIKLYNSPEVEDNSRSSVPHKRLTAPF